MNKPVDPAKSLRIGGFLPFTSVDYPGALAAVIFCQGCPLRCVYCHNRDLLPARGATQIEWREVHAHLARRKGLLDAVVFSGGEPLMQKALLPAMTAAKSLGYRIGLHTSGIAPDRLRAVLPVLDWVGFDVKAPFEKYDRVTGAKHAGRKARQSLTMLAETEIITEVRTTIWPGVIDAVDVRTLYREITEIGVQNFTLQEAREPTTRGPVGGDIFTDLELQSEMQNEFTNFTIRRVA